MQNKLDLTSEPRSVSSTIEENRWQRELSSAIRDPSVLLEELGLCELLEDRILENGGEFPLLVPWDYLRRMEPGNPDDPLLKQVLPVAKENHAVADYTADPLRESQFRRSDGILQKYRGRVLLILTGTCAVHCRYCFRKEYPYQDQPRRLEDWQKSFEFIREDKTIHEAILSGGDPLVLTDRRLEEIFQLLEEIPHLERLRIHTRLPIVLPARITNRFLNLLRSTRLKTIVVVHANHPHEIVGDCAETLRKMTRSGVTVLNQSVLLRGVNDSVEALEELSLRLIETGTMPYYLHQLDPVVGTAHFAVDVESGIALIRELRKRLPGYAIPRYVQEQPGELHKTVLA